MPDLLLGALLSVPLAIIANLLTPRIAARLAMRNEAAARRKAQESHAFAVQVDQLARDRQQLFTYLLLVTLRIALISAAVGIVATIMIAGSNWYRRSYGWALLSDRMELGDILLIGGQACTLVGSLLIINEARVAIRLAAAVSQRHHQITSREGPAPSPGEPQNHED